MYSAYAAGTALVASLGDAGEDVDDEMADVLSFHYARVLSSWSNEVFKLYESTSSSRSLAVYLSV